MIKKHDQRKHVAASQLRNMTTVEQKAFTEAFKIIESDYKTICSIRGKLQEIERSSTYIATLDSLSEHSPSIWFDSDKNKSLWTICTALMRLANNEILLCKRLSERGIEYAIIDQSAPTSRYGNFVVHLDILQTSDNPRRVLDEYLRAERQTLELMANDITASIRLSVAEQFPRQDVSRVIRLITRMCKNAAQIGPTESHVEQQNQTQRARRGVRV